MSEIFLYSHKSVLPTIAGQKHQLAFVFHLPGDFYIILDQILASFFLLQKGFIIFHKLFFKSFFAFFDVWLMNLQAFSYMRKKNYEKIYAKNTFRFFIILL